MPNTEMAQPSRGTAEAGDQPVTVIPRDHLPDNWSRKGACPVCRTPGQLRVRHQEAAPDQMLCGACGTAFEVESGGSHIRLTVAPTALAGAAHHLLNTWLMPAELPVLVEGALTLGNAPPVEPPNAVASPEAGMLHKAPVLVPFGKGGSHGAALEPEAEPGSEHWFASLAEAIGGLAPVTPPSDGVLADELERVFSTRSEPETGSNPAGDTPPTVPEAAELTANSSIGPSVAVVPANASGAVTASKSSPPNATPEAVAGNHANTVAVTAPLPGMAATAPEEAAAISNANAPVVPSATPDAGSAVVALSALPALAATAPSRRELAERAWKLHVLGNSLASIQAALEALGGSTGDIDLVMAKLVALEQARQARFRRNLQWMVGGSLVVLVILLTLAVLISQNSNSSAPAGLLATASGSVPPGTAVAVAMTAAPGQTPGQTLAAPTGTLAFHPVIDWLNKLLPGDVKIANGVSPTPAPTSAILGALFPATPTLSPAGLATAESKKSSLPPWVSTLVPNGITVINVPTPSVDSNGPPAGPCPATADQASALFGGPATSWTYDRQRAGWIFILAAQPATVRIPNGMAAGYLVVAESLEMRSVLGPATVHDVNFVAVSCN